MGRYKVTAIALLIVLGSILLGKNFAFEQYESIKSMSDELTTLREAGFDNADELSSTLSSKNIELSNLRMDNEALKKEIADLEQDYLKELNRYPKYSRSDVLTIISKLASDNNCDLKYFYILDAPEEKDATSNDIEGKYSIRIVGKFDNIVKVMESLQEETLQYSVGALSLKKDSSESFLGSPSDGVSLFQWIEEVAAQNNSNKQASKDSTEKNGNSTTNNGNGMSVNDVVNGQQNSNNTTQLGPALPVAPKITLPDLFTVTDYVLDVAILI